MGRLFSGLCQQGCWTCLDEFNRIGVEVLSVVAQQLLQVRNALLEGKTTFSFEKDEITLKPEFGCHVTMNPGYAGRTELPDNLKVLFRPVAMMIPNYGLIAEIMLAAEGFVSAKRISTKMVQLYKLSSEQLSQQKHYDFGLRAVKSVLVMAGSLKRQNPDMIEDAVLIRAMKDANVPKFLKEDLPLFFAIISDLFPGIEIKENDYGKLKVTIEKMIDERQLVKQPNFVLKVIQLFETFNVRFGVMLVGHTGSAKTACYEVLEDTMIHLRENNDPDPVYQLVKKIILNPKAISMNEMYGYVNSSQEWFDGLASKVMRLAA
jgi:dynein heavy chain